MSARQGGIAGLGVAAAVVLVLMAVEPFGAEGDAPVRTRYDCLIIRNLTGRDDVVTSSDFPKVFGLDAAPGEVAQVRPAAAHRKRMLGTTVGIAVYGMPAEAAEAAVDAAFGRIAELSKKLNIFDAESAVSRLNREAHARPVAVDDDLRRLIALSTSVAELSDGAFDATVGPLTAMWRKYRRERKLPPADEIARARALVDYRRATLDAASHVRFARPGMSFDFGGIAKGFAAMEAAKLLRARGVRSAIIDCGGDLTVIGSRPGGTSFRVGVNDPRPEADAPIRFVIKLDNVSVVTSGNYEQFTMLDGKRYSHIIDPRTGQSIAALPSVTVIGPDSGMCDALATAISVLGEKEGLKLIERVNAGMGK